MAEWIKREFGVTMSVRGISAMLGRMNFSFTKATYRLANANGSLGVLLDGVLKQTEVTPTLISWQVNMRL